MPHSKKTKAQLEREIRALNAELAKRRGGATVPEEELMKAVGFGAFAHDIMKGVDLKPLAAKAVIGFIWGYTVMSAAGSITSAVALMTLPAWVTFAFSVLIAMCGVYVALATVVPVTNFTYNSAADLVGWLRKEYSAAKGWAADAMHDYKAEAALKDAKRELDITHAPAH